MPTIAAMNTIRRWMIACAAIAIPYAAFSAVSSGHLKLGADRVYYEVDGEGPPLVFVSGGSGMDLRQWHAVAAELAGAYQVIMVDPRGMGKSDNPSERYSDSTDLLRILDELDIEKAVFVGLSSAGGGVLEFAVQFPQRVSAIVAAAPFIPDWEFSADMQKRVDGFAAAAQQGRVQFLNAMFSDHYFFPAPLDPTARDFARTVMGENYDKGASFDPSLPIPMVPPLIKRLSDISVPVMLVVGELEHPDVRRRNRYLIGQINDIREVVIRDAGHNTPLENRTAFVGAITPFLAQFGR